MCCFNGGSKQNFLGTWTKMALNQSCIIFKIQDIYHKNIKRDITFTQGLKNVTEWNGTKRY
jgi:hypothetical protein